jgi:hypothetical protein
LLCRDEEFSQKFTCPGPITCDNANLKGKMQKCHDNANLKGKTLKCHDNTNLKGKTKI